MNVHVYEQASLVPPHIHNQIQDMHLGPDGMMGQYYKHMRSGHFKGPVIVLEDLFNVLAWCLIVKDGLHYFGQFYTPHQNRRKGYGKKLYLQAKQLYPVLKVMPWDEISEAFFSKVETRSEDDYCMPVSNPVFVREPTSKPSVWNYINWISD